MEESKTGKKHKKEKKKSKKRSKKEDLSTKGTEPATSPAHTPMKLKVPTWDSVWMAPPPYPECDNDVHAEIFEFYEIKEEDQAAYDVWYAYATLRMSEKQRFIDWPEMNELYFKKEFQTGKKLLIFEKRYKFDPKNQEKLMDKLIFS